MADKDNIDKALPNVDPEVVLPKEEIVVTEEDKLSEVTPDGAEVIMDEEGGAEVNFDPMSEQQVTQDHFANIAELLPDDVIDPLGSELNENYMQYRTSRKEWEDTYTKGLDLLGFSPRTLSMFTRRFGLPGLAVSAGLWGYDKWKNRSVNDED